MKRLVYISIFMFVSTVAIGQEQGQAAGQGSSDFHMNILALAGIVTAAMVLFAALALLRAVKVIANELKNPSPYLQPVKMMLEYDEWAELEKAKSGLKPSIWNKLLGLKPIEEEGDLLLEHKFDGIAELDNPTPAWFMWLFYGSIGFAFIYLMYFHVLGYGKMQEEEYAIEMKAAKTEKAAFLAQSANNIDESSVKESKDAGVISAGQALFKTNCVACHGDNAQGVVGPNLTDEYWLHGGKINNIFKVVKYGVPEKGMISWGSKLTPEQISNVSNYIISLKGSKPANPKAPQGDKEG